ncbi:MAG: hypothetical protein GWP20_00170 [Thermotogales bacterium]|nr:hypothetical protein [Thermotogales bacterium]
MTSLPRYTRSVVSCGLGLLLALPSLSDAQYADITPFKLTGVEGDLSTRYNLDDYEQTSAGGDKTYQTRPTFEEEISILTHSYAYHPSLLNMDLGGGLLFLQQDFDSDQGKNNNTESLYNLTARLNFLEEKYYPFKLFYDRSNPSVTTSLAGRFLVENTRYGMNAALLEPFSPVSINLEAFRFESDGSGFGTSIDQTTDQAAIRTSKSYGGGNNIRVAYLWTEADSASGSTALPIQQTVTTTKTTDASALNVFGADKQLWVNQLFTYTNQVLDPQQEPSSELDDLRYSYDMRWTHTKKTNSFYQYRLLKSDRSEVNTTNRNARVGASYEQKQGWKGNFDVHGEKEDQDTTNFDRKVYGTLGVIGYSRDIRNGFMSLGASARFDQTDQSTGSTDIVQVFDENVTLNGTTPVPLQNDFVITGTIVVTNQANSQTFFEGLDYNIRVIGSVTEIQRLIGGNITDGQTVLIDYEYRSSGDVKFNTFNQNYFSNFKLFRFHDLFARYRKLDQSVKSGNPTTPLNDIENILVGARVEYPLLSGWLLGGEANYEDQEEDISPFTRKLVKAHVEAALPRSTRLRVMGRREFVDNENSPEDVDVSQVIVRLSSRPWLRTTVTADGDYEKDTGGTLNRRRRALTLGLVWRYRRLQFSVRAEHINNKQGQVTQKNNKVRAQLIRRF